MLLHKLVILIAFLITTFCLNANEIRIIVKVDNEIITNIDLENQIKYFLLTDKNLTKLSKFELFELSKNSIIRDIIKKKEIEKFIDVKDNSKLIDKLIKQKYLNLGFKNKTEYLFFLKKENLDLKKIENKLLIEQLWSSLVYQKFKNKLKINEDKIKKRIKLQYKKQEENYEVNLSEILFDFNTDPYEIKEFIDEYGFENAAARYSISNTSSNGGKIGWTPLNNLSSSLQAKVSILKEGDYTEPFKIPNGYLILMLNSKKVVKREFNLEDETKKQILFEQNRQLNSFSINYFNKLKQNTVINVY